MTTPMCSIIASAVLEQDHETVAAPYRQVATAILDDGSLFLAVNMYQPSAPQTIRLWHLSSALAVLGTVDITTALHGDSPEPYAVAIVGMKVFLVSRVGYSTPTYFSWVVDCSGATPVPGAAISMATSHTPAYETGNNNLGTFHVYDQAADKVVLAVVATHVLLQVFRASTGALLSEAYSTEPGGLIGLYVDPTDSTKFIATTTSPGAPANPEQLSFTVAVDGSSATYNGKTVIPGSPNPTYGYSQLLASANSPYGFLDEERPGDSLTNYYGLNPASLPDGELLASHDTAATVVLNKIGDSTTLGDGRYLILFYEQWDYTVWPGTNGYVGMLCCVDQLAVPPVMEMLPMPYTGAPLGTGGSAFTLGSTISADSISGVMLVGATIHSQMTGGGGNNIDTVLVWAIQGPTDKPNLTGGPLGTDIYFSGG